MGAVSDFTASPFVQIALVLLLSLLMGLEREEHKLRPGKYVAAGVRTFVLIALFGYTLVLLSPDSMVPFTAGLLAVTAFLIASYYYKQRDGTYGFTSELAALVAFVMGALVARNEYWIAVTLAVADVLLLSAKRPLQGLAARLDRGELVTFVRFLLLTAVILPIVPNQEYTQFRLNPHQTWLVVVAVSALSYGSYLLQRFLRAGDSALLTAVLGGAYSSTLTTISLSRSSAGKSQPRRYAGAIVAASAVMYVRLGILIYVFNPMLGTHVLPVFLVLAAATGGAASFILRSERQPEPPQAPGAEIGQNPLELQTAFVFAALFLVLTVVTRLVVQYLGSGGVYALAAVTGVTDVDPFVMGLTQSAGAATPLPAAAVAVAIAAASNNIAKGIYAMSVAGPAVGRPVLLAIGASGVVGVAGMALHVLR